MKCSYHPEADSHQICSACKKYLCEECANQVKGKPYCRDCLVQGAEWVTTVKDFRLPSDAPKRAALFALIPGIGAVYNNEYLKAVTYFSVFASLVVMGDTVNPVFGFGAFVFFIFTIFDAYRTSEKQTLLRLKSDVSMEDAVPQDKNILGWGAFLILIGVLFFLQNIIPYPFLYRMWPAIFIFIGGYLVYHSIQTRKNGRGNVHNTPSNENTDPDLKEPVGK